MKERDFFALTICTVFLERFTVKLQKLFLSLPVDGETSMPTSYFLCPVGGACCIGTAGLKLLMLQLFNLMITAEPDFRCFASVTLCVLLKVNNAIGNIAECAFKYLYCKLREVSPILCEFH